MGIDVYVFDFLMNFRGGDLGDGLCLGRQGLHLHKETGQWTTAEAILAAHDRSCVVQDFVAEDGYAEKFLTYLGCRTIKSLDFSPFEGAQIICDLNKPVPRGLWNRFDIIIDGGTLEHVFDVAAAIRNVKLMLRAGGLFLSVNAANNQLGHGLYQFGPELFWRAFDRQAGFNIERMQLVPLTSPPSPVLLSDPDGVRTQYGPTQAPTYLMVAARRSKMVADFDGPVYQSDYAVSWKAHRG